MFTLVYQHFSSLGVLILQGDRDVMMRTPFIVSVEVVREPLYDRYRYKVWLYLKTGLLANTVFKEFAVCGKCLRKIVEDRELSCLNRIKTVFI